MYQCSKKLLTYKEYCFFFTILTFCHVQCSHLMYVEASWVLASLETHVQPQVIVDPVYLPDYLSVSYGYGYVYVILSL